MSAPMVTHTSSQSAVEPHNVADALSVVHPLVVPIINCKPVAVRAQLSGHLQQKLSATADDGSRTDRMWSCDVGAHQHLPLT